MFVVYEDLGGLPGEVYGPFPTKAAAEMYIDQMRVENPDYYAPDEPDPMELFENFLYPLELTLPVDNLR